MMDLKIIDETRDFISYQPLKDNQEKESETQKFSELSFCKKI